LPTGRLLSRSPTTPHSAPASARHFAYALITLVRSPQAVARKEWHTRKFRTIGWRVRSLLETEADRLCNARTGARRDTRAGHCEQERHPSPEPNFLL